MTEANETILVGVRLTPEQAAWVDAQVTIGGRATVVRQLVEKAMAVDAERCRAERDRQARARATWQRGAPPEGDDVMFR